MAGKKKVNDEGLGKTARASTQKKGGKQEGFKASGDMDRIISLNNGEHAYLLDPRNGSTHHLKVNSDRWVALVQDLLETEHGDRIERELERLGWESYVG